MSENRAIIQYMKMVMYRQALILAFLITVLAHSVMGLAAKKGDLQQPAISVTPDNPHPRVDQAFNLIATIAVPSGYHVVHQSDLLNLALNDVPAGVELGPVLFPPASGTIGGFAVYSGTVVLKLPVTIRNAYADLALQDRKSVV